MKTENSRTESSQLVESISRLILSTSSEISEQVKWNSPSFYYNGDMKPFDPMDYKRDLVVLNIRPERILLVFPTGAIINDIHKVLEGKYTDGRRMVTISNMKELEDKSNSIQVAIIDWLGKIEK